MDLNGDGHDDLIAGGFGGHSYVAYGSDAGFAAPAMIQDTAGNNVRLGRHYDFDDDTYKLTEPTPFDGEVATENRQDRSEAFTVVDWDDDGDLDLLIASSGGRLYLRENTGTRAAPAYATTNTVLTLADGQPLGTGDGHGSPTVADWDGDGRFDLLSGSASGAVYLFTNTGEPGRPAFEQATTLVAAPESREAEDRSGQTTTVEVVDFDGDGQPDLLVGDRQGFVWYYRRR